MTSKRTLKTAFVTTVAAGAAVFSLATGCSSQVTFEGGGGSGTSGAGANPPGPNCPAELPDSGESCSPEGLTCNYPDENCQPTASCIGGQWQVEIYTDCNPPPCPAETPQHGSSCQGYAGYNCEYDSISCPGATDVASCDAATLTWNVDGLICNPPPPDYCFELATAELCQGAPDCTWHEPGCTEDNALPVAGCHPTSLSCSDAEWLCGAGDSCQTVAIDPCWDKPCDACAELLPLCVPEGSGGA